VAENVGWVSHESTSEMIELVNSDERVTGSRNVEDGGEGGINESDDNDLSSRQISTIVYPGDGKSVEDKLKQCVSDFDRREHAIPEGYEGMFGKNINKYSLKYPRY
jgi:hypothetical protein